MMSLILLWCSLVSFSCSADQSFSPVGVGGIIGDGKGVILGDWHQFDQGTRSFGFNRYGGGYSYLIAGNGLGVSAGDASGVFVFEPSDAKMWWALGAEPGSGQIEAHTNSSIQSFYAWTPMLSTGPAFNIDNGNQVYFALKGGAAISTMGKNGLPPYARLAHGYGIYYSHKETLTIGASYTTFNLGTLSDISIDGNQLGVKIGYIKGMWEEYSYIVMYKWNL